MLGRLERLERVRELTGIGPAEVVERRPHRVAVPAHEGDGRERHDRVRPAALEDGRPEQLRFGSVRRDHRRQPQIVTRKGGSFASQALDHGRLVAKIEADEDIERRLAQGRVLTFERTQHRREGRLRGSRRERAKCLRSHGRRWVLEHR